MKHKLAAALLLVGSIHAAPLSGGCSNGAPAPEDVAAATESATFAIEGMTCASCSVTVRTAVNHLDGIGSVSVDVEAGEATVAFDPGQTDANAIAAAISHAGYPASVTPSGG